MERAACDRIEETADRAAAAAAPLPLPVARASNAYLCRTRTAKTCIKSKCYSQLAITKYQTSLNCNASIMQLN